VVLEYLTDFGNLTDEQVYWNKRKGSARREESKVEGKDMELPTLLKMAQAGLELSSPCREGERDHF
jgi:hypothetical protein